MKRYTLKLYIILLLCLSVSGYVFGAQTDTAFIRKNLLQPNYALEADAPAIVLFEKTSIEIELGSRSYRQVEKVHRIIKILKSAGLSEATVKLYYSDYGGTHDFLSEIKGATYNLKDGKVEEVKINNTDAYTHKANDDMMETSFTMPSAREGSIIEYSYEKSTTLHQMLPAWHIQESIPKLRSEYSVTFSHSFNLISVSHVYVPFTETHSTIIGDANNYPAYHVGANSISNMDQTVTWVRKDIPSLNEEPYARSLISYKERLDIILENSFFMNDNAIEKSWDQLNTRFWTSEVFGKQITANNRFLNDVVDSIVAVDTSAEGRTKNIFKYVRSNFQTTNTPNTTFRKSKMLKNVFENRAGNSYEISLLLIAMLKNASVYAAPVMLSIQGSLPLSASYPLVNRLNYIVCLAKVNNDTVYLDPTEKYYPYNVLPDFCYNGFAWVVDSKGYAVNLDKNLTKEKNVFVVQLNFENDTAAKLNIVEKFGPTMSAVYRKIAMKDTAELNKAMRKTVESLPGDVTLVNMEIFNQNNADTNIIVKYSCVYNTEKDVSNYYVNSQFIKFFSENPFKTTQRKLPIDFPFKMNYSCLESIKLPPSLQPDGMPQPVAVDYADGKMDYKQIVNYNNDIHTIIVNSNFTMDETQYDAENYETMKRFFEQIIKEENNVLTIKKVAGK